MWHGVLFIGATVVWRRNIHICLIWIATRLRLKSQSKPICLCLVGCSMLIFNFLFFYFLRWKEFFNKNIFNKNSSKVTARTSHHRKLFLILRHLCCGLKLCGVYQSQGAWGLLPSPSTSWIFSFVSSTLFAYIICF